MRRLPFIAVIVTLLFAGTAYADVFEKVVKPAELEDLVVKVGGVKYNNFICKEKKMFKDQVLECKVNARTKEMKKKYTRAAIYMAMMDKDNKLVAAFMLKRALGLKPNDSQELSARGPMAAGELKRVTSIMMRVVIAK